jgi:hypothetical protein
LALDTANLQCELLVCTASLLHSSRAGLCDMIGSGMFQGPPSPKPRTIADHLWASCALALSWVGHPGDVVESPPLRTARLVGASTLDVPAHTLLQAVIEHSPVSGNDGSTKFLVERVKSWLRGQFFLFSPCHPSPNRVFPSEWMLYLCQFCIMERRAFRQYRDKEGRTVRQEIRYLSYYEVLWVYSRSVVQNKGLIDDGKKYKWRVQ